MSGPYRFTNDNTRSPLDRQPPNVFQAGQPPSFKTNVNRAKTKKWVEAKPYSYDGDDWGEYDEYDEYGADQPPPPPPNPSVPTGLRQPGQRVAEPSRSFTDPQRQPSPSVPGRRNSFEAGDEYRTFSATTSQASGYGQPGYAAVPQDHVRSSRQPSAAESHVSDTPQHRRDFSPSALPPPLNTRPSPAPGNTTDSSASATFPPRKSSVGQGDTPITNPASLRDRASSNSGKSLPFVRPADIYKRVEEERQRERASLDSSRPSLDSLASRSKDDSVTLQGGDIEKSLRSLETVAERKSEYLTDVNSAEQEKPRPDASDEGPKASQQPSLPQVEGISAFDNDFWSGGPQAQKAPALFSPEDNGLRSVVNQAFTRSDDQRSVPATPISKDSESGVSRSNTDSTSGISPIMSRVPSSATSALRSRNAAGETSTPAIAEETSENSTPVSGPVSGAMLSSDPYQVPRKPSPGHSRDISNPSLPRGGLSTPSPGESPARSPAIEPQKPVPEPESALLGSRSPTSSDNIEDRSGGPSSTYASREADIATAMRISPDNAVPELGAAEKESQNAFLDSHQNAQSPLPSAVPHSRSESPSKGRVQELVGKFGEVSHSRRGSTQSNASRTSVQSWEQSQDNSRPSSLTKAGTSRSGSPTKESSTQRPLAEREASFRPKLPGQWESYATAATPSEHGDREIQSIVENEPAAQGRLGSSPLGEVDLTPTTAKHPMSAIEPMDSSTDPLAALKAAGTAVGEAIQASSGLGLFKQVPPNEHDEQERNRTIGNINLARPVQLERTTSSVASSIPPTPPAKDTPDSEGLPPPPPLKDLSPELNSPNDQAQTLTQPTIAAQLSTEASADGQESARLRKEIVTSLSPQKSVEISNAQSERASLQPTVPDITNRESSILPSEYDSYWADGGHTSFHQSNDLDQNNSEHSPVETKPVNHPSTDLGKPSLLSRFSWEDNIPHTISHQQTRAGANESPKETPVEENKVLVTSQLNVNSPPSETFAGIPDPYFGPVHIAAVTKPDPVKDSDFTARSPSPVLDSAKSASDLTQVETIREASPASGLHVVNSDLNPEAVDIPPRLSAEVLPQSQLPQASEEKRVKLLQEEGAEQPPNVIPVPASTVEPPVAQETAPKSPTSDKPLGFREIVTLSSSSERIATYNKTRDYWAHTDHGLNDWMVSAMAANPELASQPIPQQQPQITTSGTFRHKHTGSLSLFGKHHHGLSGQPSNDQSAVVQTPTTPTSSGAAVALGSSAGGGRSASHQMQVKGKDLLHTAEILGGKGMKGAKGLFAKGKSRFRASGSGDKVSRSQSVTSSREASEPEIVTTTPDKRTTRMSFDLDNPKEEKKRRRFSSPFHRSSRSGSRPSSIVLPKSALLDSGISSTPRNTPPRETPPAEGSRPHSFHAPDAWNYMPDPHKSGGHCTPPPGSNLLPPERLGVLPSPAKSAFSLPQEREGDIPPVPPIPNDIEERAGGCEAEKSASQRVLQSVIRHSSPPNMETEKLQQSPIFGSELSRTEREQENHDAGRDEARVSTMEEKLETEDRDDRPMYAHSVFVLSKPSPPPVDQGHRENANAGAEKSATLSKLDNDEGHMARPPGSDHAPLVQAPLPQPHDHVSEQDMKATTQKQNVSKPEQIEDEDEDDQPPQLNHEPIPVEPTPIQIGHASDISPPSVPEIPEDGGVSPVVSSIGPTSLSEEDDDDDDDDDDGDERPPQIELSFLQRPILGRGSVSPMLPPAALAGSNASDGPQTPVGHADAQRAFEMKQIGAGDVSPISSHALDDKETTPTKASINEHKHTADFAVEVKMPLAAGAESAASGDRGAALAPHTGQSAAEPPPGRVSTQQRLYASPYQVVHAVQYVPSHSSLESWEQESVIAPSHSDGSQMGDRPEDRDVPPVPLIPGSLQHETTNLTPEPEQKAAGHSASNGFVKQHPARSESSQLAAQHLPMDAASQPASHRRSQSLLSAISSAVSAERLPITPTSDQAGRSRPSSANRQLQVSPARDTPSGQQMKGQGPPAQQKTSDATSDEEYDLYADHNGIVKGIQDERGQLLRVATTEVPNGPQVSQQYSPDSSRNGNTSQSQYDDDQRRYSDERPMSFVSGPRDANGRPQDQINAPTPAPVETNIPPVPRIPSQIQRQTRFQDSPVDPMYIPPPQPKGPPQPTVEREPQRDPDSRAGRLDVSPLPSHQELQRPQNQPHSNVSPPPPSNTSPPPQASAPPGIAERAILKDPRTEDAPSQVPRVRGPQMIDPRLLQDPRFQDPRLMADPRMPSMLPGQLYSQDPRDPRFQMQMQMQRSMHPQDPRRQAQIAGSPNAPRNQYELHQQMMQRQAMDPRLRLSDVGLPQSGIQAGKHEEKHSSRPKLASVFRNLGSKASSAPSPSNQANDRVNPNLAVPKDPSRIASYQSSLGDLPEQMVAKKERKPGVFHSLGNRPQSVGTESHISHDSTMVQAADSRLDLRYPASPSVANGIPPPHPPSGAVNISKQNQTHRASASPIPDSGKKKRFSTLSSLFSRGGSTGAVPQKPIKLSKEERKAQKAQKHATAPPIQPPQVQQWPQQLRPYPYDPQYGQAPTAPRPFPGMQGARQQTTPPPAMPSQGFPPRSTPQQYMQPQGYGQQQQPVQQQSIDGSAYMSTRQLAQEHQSQQATPQTSRASSGYSRPDIPGTGHPHGQPLEPPQSQSQGPPPSGYYSPDSKRPPPELDMRGETAISKQQQPATAAQKNPHSRRVSSPPSTHSQNRVTPVSQRHVSAPLSEPRYETPQIPAAYTHVSGAYVSPSAESPTKKYPSTYSPPSQRGYPQGRQYSDPHMQQISPQISEQSQTVATQRTHSESSSHSVVSPISNPSPGMSTVQLTSNQRPQKSRMSSISEAAHQERPWNFNVPEGATEQEIVRARQQQYMLQQLAAQEQAHAERSGRSPSPHPSRHTHSPSPNTSLTSEQPQQQASAVQGFREVLPRSSPQPYQVLQQQQHQPSTNVRTSEEQQAPAHTPTPQPLEPAPIHPEQALNGPAAYPLPTSPDSANAKSPVNPLADALPPPPPPKIPHSPMQHGFIENQKSQQQDQPLPNHHSDYEQQPLDEPPPSYDGPSIPNAGMEKERQERHRPPNIMTDGEIQGLERERELRQRQASLGILQHPQPASMAASPQRSSADMGADILRQQLLQQEERNRLERASRAEFQHAESERERQERERARARARELERSISGGGRVSSLRSVGGSGRGTAPGWEQRGSRTTAIVYELPAEEDDEPVMRATSFPGQEWVPTWTED